MAFSESFGLGNSTFMDLESEVNKALQVKPKNPQNSGGTSKRAANPLDVIDESPTNSKEKSNKSRSRHHVSQFSAQRRKVFQKSKSDSTLNEKSLRTSKVSDSKKQVSKDDNYSEFFRSEFSIEEDRNVKNKLASLVSTSQIDAAVNGMTKQVNQNEVGPVNFDFEDSRMFSEMIGDLKSQYNDPVQGENASEALEVPVSSEDVQALLNDSVLTNDASLIDPVLSEEDWKESLKFSEFEEEPVFQVDRVNENMQGIEEPEEVVNIDDATFICPDEDGRDFIEKTLNDIKIEVQSSLKEEEGQEYEKSVAKTSSVSNSESMAERLPVRAELLPHRPTTEPYKMKSDLEELKRISAWNLPSSVLKEYAKKGINKMFDWQIECLSNPKVLFDHSNLVYSAPTSAGKTLVSEILLIKTILERGKKVIIILPFISVVREKMFYLQDLLTPSGYRVEGFFGGYTPPGGFDSINVAICTIEKANSIVNKLLERGKLDEIGTVVVDEIHLISDPGRGYILELLLAKVLYMSKKYALQIQIITMSATLANVELLKKWLDAELYITNYRPVALQEMIKIGTKIYNSNLEFLRDLRADDFGGINDQDHVAQLCVETIAEGCSVVVFCPSKDWCENLSMQLAGAIHAIGRSGSEIGNKLRANIKRDAIEEVKKQLKDIPTGLDSVLEKTINYACAFHHAGLTTEERDIIEACFKSGALKIIVATSTLSSGVNLPARRVIIRSPLFGGKQMSSLTYKQMIGRAGRTGKDTLGESILICTDSNARIGKDLVSAALTPICSCLEMESSTHLKRALLEVISSGVATTKTDIENFFKCTLLNTQKEIDEMEKIDGKEESTNQGFIFDSIDFLIEYEFIRLQRDEENDKDKYVATRLGMACLASSMPPTDGLILFSELQKSRRCFVLESELHAVYLVTPYSVCYQMQDLDWLMYLDLWEKLSPAMKKVGELVGVKESFLVRAMRGQIKLDYKLMQIHKRFYTALALQELVNETPVNIVAAKYKCTRGMLQSLQQMASTFAGIVTAFCNSLNWSMLSLIVGQFKERLYFGVHRDLIDLMRLPDLNYKRARALFDSGIESLIDLANADIFTIEKILHNSLSFDTAKKLENEDEYETNQRNNMRNLYITGKAGLTVKEAAKMLVSDARQFVQYEIGVGNINWSLEKGKVDGVDESSALQMSCEGGNSKRKSNTDCSDASPPKIQKDINGGRRKENAYPADKYVIQRNEDVDVNAVSKSSDGTSKSEGKCTIPSENNVKISKNSYNMQSNLIQNDITANSTNPNKGTKNVNAGSKASYEMSPKSNRKCTVQRESSEIISKNNGNMQTNKIQRTEDVTSRNPSEVSNVSNGASTVSNGKCVIQRKHIGETKRNSDTLQEKFNTKDVETVGNLKKAIQKKCVEVGDPITRKDGKNPAELHVSEKLKNIPKGAQSSRLISAKTKDEDASKENDNKNLNLGDFKPPHAIEPQSNKALHTKYQAPSKEIRLQSGHTKEQGNKIEDLKESHSLEPNPSYKHPKTIQSWENGGRRERVAESNILPSNKEAGCTKYIHKESEKANPRVNPLGENSNQIKAVRSHNIEKESEERRQKISLGKTNISPTVRRSPRNHLTSSTRIEKPSSSDKAEIASPDNDLFMDDTLFEMNSAITNAMKDRKDVKEQPPRKSLNKSSDEIASSQEMTFQPKTQSTRYLRSYKDATKTTPKRTPLRRKSEKDSSPAPERPPPNVPTNKSSTMEVSDITLGNSLMQNPIQLNSSHILSTSKTEPDALSLKCIQIIDICGSQMLFKNAIKVLTEVNTIGFSVGIEKQANKRQPLIGANLLINQVGAKETSNEEDLDFPVDDSSYVAGVSMVMNENVSFFINLQAENTGKGVTREMKIDAVRKFMANADVTLQIFDSKEQLKALIKAIPGIQRVQCKIEDPKVANWLLQPDKTMSFANMAQQFAPECKALVKLSGSGRGYCSIGLDSSSAIFGKVRSSIEACVTMHILKGQVENLERIGTGQLHKFFVDLEMPLQLSLCDMEMYGFPANEAALRELFQQMMDAMKKLETKIYEAHGSRFNLSSTSAVARVLGLHRKANGRVSSTSKQILEKIDSPIALMIISYRKLSVILTKTIQPMLRSVVDNRIRGQSITFTSTGRISMQEPNLQNIAKDFEVVIGASEKINISCRSSFFPPKGRCLISADFCQLEMRILAHLSQDPPLLRVMNSEKDVFTAIAAKWNKIPEDSVSEQLRNGTKQICYGIVYGMGMRSLAESLKCSEQEAKTVSEQFHAAYPGIRVYAEKVMRFAKQHGYVETITGRRRYLDNISSGELQLKSQSERQAVNSTIQGSAADIAKSAILRMEKNVTRYQEKMGLSGHCVNLVLHLHDELIFEVPEDKAKKVAKVLSITMENCVRLSVPLKVKLKIGKSWGDLREVKL